MCLLVVAWDRHPEHRLIVAANRDEAHARPTHGANWWTDEPDIAGGRDLQAGGTWLAMHRQGRFAAVTNVRGVLAQAESPRSRGHLVSDFLKSRIAPFEFLRAINRDDYAGFNLLVADASSLAYVSNHGGEPRSLPAGIYGLGNRWLDSDCEKVRRSKSRLEYLLSADRAHDAYLIDLLGDSETPTGDPVDAPFVVQPAFGTRCSTIVRMNRQGAWQLLEKRFDRDGNGTGESRLGKDM